MKKKIEEIVCMLPFSNRGRGMLDKVVEELETLISEERKKAYSDGLLFAMGKLQDVLDALDEGVK